MKKMLMTTTLVATLFLGSLSANAVCPCQGKGGMMPPPGQHHFMQKPLTAEQKAKMEQRKAEIDKRLNITEEQKAKLKAIHEKSKAEIAPKVKQLTEVEYELDVLNKKEFASKTFGISTLENVKLSGKSVDQLRNEAKALRNEIRAIRKANFEACQAVFTAEQKQELEKMKKEHVKNFKKFRKGNHKPAVEKPVTK